MGLFIQNHFFLFVSLKASPAQQKATHPPAQPMNKEGIFRFYRSLCSLEASLTDLIQYITAGSADSFGQVENPARTVRLVSWCNELLHFPGVSLPSPVYAEDPGELREWSSSRNGCRQMDGERKDQVLYQGFCLVFGCFQG